MLTAIVPLPSSSLPHKEHKNPTIPSFPGSSTMCSLSLVCAQLLAICQLTHPYPTYSPTTQLPSPSHCSNCDVSSGFRSIDHRRDQRGCNIRDNVCQQRSTVSGCYASLQQRACRHDEPAGDNIRPSRVLRVRRGGYWSLSANSMQS